MEPAILAFCTDLYLHPSVSALYPHRRLTLVIGNPIWFLWAIYHCWFPPRLGLGGGAGPLLRRMEFALTVAPTVLNRRASHSGRLSEFMGGGYGKPFALDVFTAGTPDIAIIHAPPRTAPGSPGPPLGTGHPPRLRQEPLGSPVGHPLLVATAPFG